MYHINIGCTPSDILQHVFLSTQVSVATATQMNGAYFHTRTRNNLMVLAKIQVTIIGVNAILSIVHWLYQRWHAPLKNKQNWTWNNCNKCLLSDSHTAAVRVCGGRHCSLKHWYVIHCTNNLNLLCIRSMLNYRVLRCLSSIIPLVHWHWWCRV